MERKNSKHRKLTAAETSGRGEKVANFEGKVERIEVKSNSYQRVEEIDPASGIGEHKEAEIEPVSGHEGV